MRLYINGTITESTFTRLETAALTENPASVKILDRLMCKVDASNKIHDDKVQEFVLQYEEMQDPPLLGAEPEDSDSLGTL
jgi:hypothetical protein